MIVSYTILFGHREKPDTSFEIAIETLSFSWACYWLAGIISFQTKKCLGRQPQILLYKQHGV